MSRIIVRSPRSGLVYRPRPATITRILEAAAEHHENPFMVLLDMAIGRWYGRSYSFWRDLGLYEEGIYGNVGCWVDTGGIGSISILCTLRIDVSVDGKDVNNCSEFLQAIGQNA